jgi:hypothetical protein
MKTATRAPEATNDEVELGGAEQFRRLTAEGQARYAAHAQRMFSGGNTIPDIFVLRLRGARSM